MFSLREVSKHTPFPYTYLVLNPVRNRRNSGGGGGGSVEPNHAKSSRGLKQVTAKHPLYSETR